MWFRSTCCVKPRSSFVALDSNSFCPQLLIIRPRSISFCLTACVALHFAQRGVWIRSTCCMQPCSSFVAIWLKLILSHSLCCTSLRAVGGGVISLEHLLGITSSNSFDLPACTALHFALRGCMISQHLLHYLAPWTKLLSGEEELRTFSLSRGAQRRTCRLPSMKPRSSCVATWLKFILPHSLCCASHRAKGGWSISLVWLQEQFILSNSLCCTSLRTKGGCDFAAPAALTAQHFRSYLIQTHFASQLGLHLTSHQGRVWRLWNICLAFYAAIYFFYQLVWRLTSH